MEQPDLSYSWGGSCGGPRQDLAMCKLSANGTRPARPQNTCPEAGFKASVRASSDPCHDAKTSSDRTSRFESQGGG
eukprot:8429924-Pyramimonas_sp.AAC.1